MSGFGIASSSSGKGFSTTHGEYTLYWSEKEGKYTVRRTFSDGTRDSKRYPVRRKDGTFFSPETIRRLLKEKSPPRVLSERVTFIKSRKRSREEDSSKPLEREGKHPSHIVTARRNPPRRGRPIQTFLRREEERRCGYEFLDYSNRGMEDRDLKGLIRHLRKRTGEFSLYLADNKITAVGVRLLRNLPNMKELNISNNPIGSEGASALARSRTLKVLRANSCGIRFEGAAAFLECASLEDLWLVANDFDQGREDWIDKINRVLENNKARNNPVYREELRLRREREALEKSVMEAIDQEDIERLYEIIPHLENGVNTRLEWGGPLLRYAYRKRSILCAQELLKMGARMEDHEREYTLLFNAAEDGCPDFVELFLKKGGNITGEFYFNRENAISIAQFKLKEAANRISKRSFLRFPEGFREVALRVMHKCGILHSLTPSLWDLLRAQDSSKTVCIEEWPIRNFKNRVRVLELLLKKLEPLAEKAPSTELDGYSTDEDLDLELAYSIRPAVAAPPREFQNLSPKALKGFVDRLNAELKEGKTEADIDWSAYPRFFIAQYRGIHYYRHHFSKGQRKDHRATSHLNRMTPASVAYLRSGFSPKEHQLARESILRRNKAITGETFSELGASGPVQQYWPGKKHTFLSSSDALLQRSSNSYPSYHKDLEERDDPGLQLLRDRRLDKGYTFLDTSDLPLHALKYAYGQKQISGQEEKRLRPDFQRSGKTPHPYPGKVFITLFSPMQMHMHGALHTAGKHNRKKIGLTGVVAPERETSMPGGVEAEVSFYEELMVIPSFECYKEEYEEKYGIKEALFNRWKKKMAAPSTDLQKLADNILKKITGYRERQLFDKAFNEAKRRGGYLIFRHETGEYGVEFEPMRIPSRGEDPTFTKAEEALLEHLCARSGASSSTN